jgi:methyltransferase-like protein
MAARAASHGLEYLGESCRPLDLSDLGPAAQAWLQEEARSRIELEQSLDFFRNASFRRSLFCHAGVRLDEPSPERLRPLHFNTLCQPLSRDPDVKSPREELFKGDNRQLATDIPLVKAILVALHAVWPRTLTLPELTADVRRRLDATDDPELTDELVAEAALQCYGASLLAVHVWAPPFCTTVSDRPAASPLARLQARAALRQPGSAGHGVSNLRHREIVLERVGLEVLAALDGTRDRAALTAALTHEGEDPASAAARVAESIARLAHAALLVS